MTVENDLFALFQRAIAERTALAKEMVSTIVEASASIAETLLQQNTLIVCGDESSHLLASHAHTIFMSSFELQRPGLPVILLQENSGLAGRISASEGLEMLYAKQLHTMAKTGDCLLMMPAYRTSNAMLELLDSAHRLGVRVIVMSNQVDERLVDNLEDTDIHLPLPFNKRASIMESQLMVIHGLCQLVDYQLFGNPMD